MSRNCKVRTMAAAFASGLVACRPVPQARAPSPAQTPATAQPVASQAATKEPRALAERVQALVDKLTTEEKIAVIGGDNAFGAVALERFGLRKTVYADSSPGLRASPDMPAWQVHYREGILLDYRWFDAKGIEPLFPFGHGLSYTQFEYAELRIEQSHRGQAAGRPGPRAFEVTLQVRNTGEVAGKEAVQLYLQDVEASEPRPLKELKGIQKLGLRPGEATRVRFSLNERSFAFWSETAKAWLTEPGEFIVHVGSSSRDIRARASLLVH